MPDWAGPAGKWPAHDSLGPHGCRVALFGLACHVFGFAESDWLCGLGRKIFVPLLELRLLDALRWRLASLDQHLVMEELYLSLSHDWTGGQEESDCFDSVEKSA